MKKAIFTGAIIVLLIIGAYLFGEKSPTLEHKIINTLTKEELFTKKVECGKYTKEITDNLQQDTWAIETLHQVFYSPVRNSCLSEIGRAHV